MTKAMRKWHKFYPYTIIISVLFGLFLSCSGSTGIGKNKTTEKAQRLPFYGKPSIISKRVDGKLVVDTIIPTIPNFSLVNQLGDTVSMADLKGHIYVADFFFTTCPTICPKMKRQLLRVYKEFKDNPKVQIVSHTIDPMHDTVQVLYNFAERLGVKAPKWHFLTGDKDAIYAIADNYAIIVKEEKNAPGGFNHSGTFVLVDTSRYIRGIYNGTSKKSVNRLIKDIKTLLEKG